AVADPLSARQRETAAAGADHERGDCNLQPVEKIGLEEARYGRAAALDEHGAKPAPMQRREHRVEREQTAPLRDADDLGLPMRLARRRARRGRDEQRRRGPIGEYAEL